ncbi:glycosyl transferase [Pseudooceanicola nanhaiensis]|jgi:glycosyltransferase involved in cell wall biosynthesis|uniref:Glycosyl transferase n=1 Tax=Pseudooceanicola nanhaiensis TaxID=375761 RepID=A0A917WI86_9RHOB|nr:glycosyltransferase [Pseudooceanicola nanhaiensis]GGM06098.1 glycosyl transferase [Pseudooceanicola nanhaiensis]
MKVLFIHQNFPGQFKHLSVALARQGHEVVSLTLRVKQATTWNGVRLVPYALRRKTPQNCHPWVTDLDSKVTRGEACFHAATKLKAEGFTPDIIIAHPGWGESLFLRDVWPEVPIGLYCELYHLAGYPHAGFDPEFDRGTAQIEPMRIRMKNINNQLHFDAAQAGLSPTRFQADTFPEPFRSRISVIHDGIDTDALVADPGASVTVPGAGTFTRDDEVVTFVNRNLEPYRGYHVFMRALPRLLATRPEAQVLIVGGDGVSYGAAPPDGRSWKQTFIDEVRGDIPDADWARVHFLGRMPYGQFTALLQVARVHVYLTYPFVLSWSLFEAMSCEGAIVASDTAPVREAITHDVTGRLVDFFDGDALVEEVGRLLDDPEARRRLGRAARAHVRETYDLRSICLPRQLDWVSDLADMTV